MVARKYDYELIIRELKAGTDRAVIAKMARCTTGTVHRIASMKGIAQARTPKYDRELILAGIERGTPRKAIAAQAGCPIDYVHRVATQSRQADQKPSRAPSSPTASAAMYEPITGVPEEDAARVRADLEKRGPDFAGLLAMLGLVPEVAA